MNTGERMKRRNIISERKFGEGNGKYSEENREKNNNRRYRKAGMACGKKTRRVDSTITARNFSPVFTGK